MPAIVINVILALDRITRSLKNAGQAGAIGSAPTVAYMQRAGWIGRNKLDSDFVLWIWWLMQRRMMPS